MIKGNVKIEEGNTEVEPGSCEIGIGSTEKARGLVRTPWGNKKIDQVSGENL